MVKVYKIARYARSLIDLLSILAAFKKRELRFRRLTELVDTSTSAGRMVMRSWGFC